MTLNYSFRTWIWLTALLAIATPAGAAAPEGEQADTASSAAPEYGFNAPSLEGDWRFRVKLNAWIPTSIPVTIYEKVSPPPRVADFASPLTPFRDFERRAREPRRVRDKTTVTANFLIDNFKYMVPIDGEVRKGSFGFFAHTLFFKIEGNRDVGKRPGHELKFDDHGFIIDTGLSYELGTWALGEGLLAPRLTLEPFVAARLIHDPVDLNLDPSRFGTKTVRLSTYVPIVGLRTFWDFGEHWNLQIDGDWGGWDIDDNHKTYQLLGLLGYRFQAGGLSWNVQAGYRYFQIFDLRRAARVKLQARGPQLSIGLDF